MYDSTTTTTSKICKWVFNSGSHLTDFCCCCFDHGNIIYTDTKLFVGDYNSTTLSNRIIWKIYILLKVKVFNFIDSFTNDIKKSTNIDFL